LWQQQRCLHINDGNNPIVTRVTTPLDNSNNAIATRATMLLQQRQRCLDCKDACASTMATPAQQGEQHQLDNSKAACASMTTTTPLWQGQWHQLDDYASLITAEMPLQWRWQSPLQQQQRHLCINGNKAIETRTKCHCNDGKDACSLMMMTMPLQGGQWCQLKDRNNVIATRATMPLRIKGNNAIVTRAMSSAWWRQGCLCIDKNNNAIIMRAAIAIVTMAKTPVHQQQQCHHNKGNNTIAMMAKMPAHWWWQWRHCNKSGNASLGMATTPLQQGQQCHHGSRATMPLLQGQQCQLDDGKDACTSTMATKPSSWGWQLRLQQRQRCLCIYGNNAITMRVTTPDWQKATRAMALAWQWWRCVHIDNGNNAIACAHTQTNISYLCVHVCMHPSKHIIFLSSHASLQT
jgi:hypothetical protein